jgi:hypothetical protein
MSINRLAFGISTTAILVGAGIALASSTTNTPASACIATGGKLTVGSGGEAVNNGTALLTAVCPVDRDVTPPATTTFSGTMWVVDQNSSADVCCTLHSRNPASGIDTAGQPGCTGGSSASVAAVSIPSITDTKTFSHVFLQCQVPAVSGSNASEIITYRIVAN